MSVTNVPDIALSLGLLVKMLSIKDDLSLQNLVGRVIIGDKEWENTALINLSVPSWDSCLRISILYISPAFMNSVLVYCILFRASLTPDINNS